MSVIPSSVSNLKETFGPINEKFDELDNTNTSHQQQITTNNLARIAALTAHIESISAHAASAITAAVAGLAAGNVNAALVELLGLYNNIVSQAGTDNTEIVDARMGADGTARATLGTLIREIHAILLTAATQSAALTHGWNYVLSDTDSPLNVRVYGRTLVNLLGKDGNFEAAGAWTLSGSSSISTDESVYGAKCFKTTDGSGTSSYDIQNIVQNGKYYLLAAHGQPSTGTPVINVYGGSSNISFAGSLTDAWDFKYVKFVGNSSTSPQTIQILNTGGVTYVDGMRLYEISAADYAGIDTMTTDQVAAKWPYVDDVKHLSQPAIEVPGKNLNSPFTEWSLHTNAVVTEPYSMTLNATAGLQNSSMNIPVIAGKAYTISAESISSGGQISIQYMKADSTVVDTSAVTSSVLSVTLTPPANTVSINLVALSFEAGTFTFTNVQVELGSSATDFVPANPSYLYGVQDINGNPIKLGSNVDGSVQDELYQQGENWYVLPQFKLDVALDGSSLDWAWDADWTGFKSVRLPLGVDVVSNTGNVARYDGKIFPRLPAGDSPTTADVHTITTVNDSLYLVLFDTDTGWWDSWSSLTQNVIKAYFNGWKYNGDEAYSSVSWESILDGSAPATNTEAYVIANKAPGWDKWGSFDYQLAQSAEPVAVQVEGALSIPSGGAQIRVNAGVVIEEPANPVQYNVTDKYYINNNAVTGLVGTNCNLENKAEEILVIYKNGVKDDKWTIVTHTDSYGDQFASIPSADYDGSADYTVTYISLDKYSMTANATDAEIEYQTSDHSVLVQTVHKQADIETNVSIALNALVDVYARLKALEG